MITMSRWKYLWNDLAALFFGMILGQRYAAAGWFQPVTTILGVLLVLGLLFAFWEDIQKRTKDRKP